MSRPNGLADWLAQWPQLRDGLARQVEAAEKEGRIPSGRGLPILESLDAALKALVDFVQSSEGGDTPPPATLTLVKGGKHGGKGKGRQ